MNFITLTTLLLIVVNYVTSSKVLELSDKFIDISKEGTWFVKFYAPWCAYCSRLEPVWAHVAQGLYSTPIKVAKVDCTRFPAITSHFQIRAYPTIMFIKGTSTHVYNGERIKEDMVNFALRMAQPPIQKVSYADSIDNLKDQHDIFFGYIGEHQGTLWEIFTIQAIKYQPHAWFYSMNYDVIKKELKPPNASCVFVYKEDDIYFFETSPELLQNKENINTTLDKWVHAERFGFFPKITRSNFNEILEIKKYIVIAVVSENKLNEISQTEKFFKDMMEEIIRSKKHELHHKFQFGWMGTPDLANSIVMYDLSIPHLIVLNSTTHHHHLPDIDPVFMTPEAVIRFLDAIHNQIAPTYGGKDFIVRLYRGFYEARATVSSMWRGNPILTALVFGLPLGFLSLLCYSMFCADILDAEEEETTETHEKRD
ncbi:unnamed protein product [Leptosia nina]|uniref:Thioredoxin domain-containing protein n=1 Tax=Leptosia nina TaxID=320188 RepID=A0AAV1K588_9NEOP